MFGIAVALGRELYKKFGTERDKNAMKERLKIYLQTHNFSIQEIAHAEKEIIG